MFHLLPSLLMARVDPACHAGVDRLPAGPRHVIADVAHRLDLLVDGQSPDLRELHPKVLLDPGLMVTVPGEPPFFPSDGDKVHPHVVLGGGRRVLSRDPLGLTQ